jgi:imidazolonepropionase-like amidohydrolase
MTMRILLFLLMLLSSTPSLAQEAILLRPARVFDGVDPHPHDGWTVLVRGERIEAAGPDVAAPAGARVIDLPGMTLMPGMIEGHSHLFLHPYDEASWDDQVLRESTALRTARAVAQARATLMAGFTSIRDLGTEGAGYADAGLRDAIDRASCPVRACWWRPGLWSHRSYGPRTHDATAPLLGAEEADGPGLVAATRRQIGGGADVVKFYADYRWRAGEDSRPTFTMEEMRAATEAAHAAGRLVAAHAQSPDGMRNAILAGVDTIEHGNGGTAEIFRLMHRARVRSPDPRGDRSRCPLSRLERRGAGARGRPRASRQLRRGAGGRRDDLHGRRFGRVPPWRQCSRDGADGRLRHAPGRRHGRRHLGQCPPLPRRRPGRRGAARPAC